MKTQYEVLADTLDRLAMTATSGEWTSEKSGRGSWIGNNGHWAALACGDDDAEADANSELILTLKNSLPDIIRALRSFDRAPSNDLIEQELRKRYPSAFDGSDRLENDDTLKPENMRDWVLAYYLLRRAEKAETE